MTIHDQIRNLEERPDWALARPNYQTAKVARAFLEHTQTKGTSDAHRASRCALTAMRLTKIVGQRCLRVSGLALFGGACRMLGKLDIAERCFRHAFRLAGDCFCCLPELNRQYAYLLSEQGRHSLAIERATHSLQMYQERDDIEGIGKAFLCRGSVLTEVGDIATACIELKTAYELIPPAATTFHNAAYQYYVYALSKSQDISHVEMAAALLPEARERYVGIRGVSVERAKLDWLEGGVAAKLADLKPDLSYLERYVLRCKARQFLADALDQFLAQGMPLEVTAVASDLAAVEAALDAAHGRVVVRQLMANTLEKISKAADAPLAAMRQVVAACRKADGTGPMLAALRELRDATVQAGCAPPLVPYPDPATAL